MTSIIQCISHRANTSVHHVRRRNNICACFGEHNADFREHLNRWVIQDGFAFHQSVMAVVCVGVERDIDDNADIGHGFFNGAHSFGDKAFWVGSLSRIFGFVRRRNVRENRHGRNAKVCGLLRLFYESFDGKPLHAW